MFRLLKEQQDDLGVITIIKLTSSGNLFLTQVGGEETKSGGGGEFSVRVFWRRFDVAQVWRETFSTGVKEHTL